MTAKISTLYKTPSGTTNLSRGFPQRVVKQHRTDTAFAARELESGETHLDPTAAVITAARDKAICKGLQTTLRTNLDAVRKSILAIEGAEYEAPEIPHLLLVQAVALKAISTEAGEVDATSGLSDLSDTLDRLEQTEAEMSKDLQTATSNLAHAERENIRLNCAAMAIKGFNFRLVADTFNHCEQELRKALPDDLHLEGWDWAKGDWTLGEATYDPYEESAANRKASFLAAACARRVEERKADRAASNRSKHVREQEQRTKDRERRIKRNSDKMKEVSR